MLYTCFVFVRTAQYVVTRRKFNVSKYSVQKKKKLFVRLLNKTLPLTKMSSKKSELNVFTRRKYGKLSFSHDTNVSQGCLSSFFCSILGKIFFFTSFFKFYTCLLLLAHSKRLGKSPTRTIILEFMILE